MKTITRSILIAGIAMLTQANFAQVGIGTTTPNASAELDIFSANRGLLLPRVSLTNTTLSTPLAAHVAGMTVYNIAPAVNDVSPGLYYNDGTKWIAVSQSQSNDWSIIGNSGTVPGTNFIGTTDAQDFVIRTNNTEKARMTSAGNLGVGIAAPTAKTHIRQTTNDNAVVIDNTGLGNGLEISQSNTGAAQQALLIEQLGTDANSRGIQLNLGVTNPAIGHIIFHNGIGRGNYTNLSNAANTSTASSIYHDGIGNGTYTQLTNTANTRYGSIIVHDGIGSGSVIDLTNTANPEMILNLTSDGTGRGQQIALGNAANGDIGLGIFHSGTDGTGAYVAMTSAAATRNSVGLSVQYEGTAAGAGGGGNALEVSHGGTNGNAVDIFLGDPTAAPGNANTTSEYSGITVAHMGTGTAGAGRTKSAISASNNSADPTISVNNDGTEEGTGVQVFVTPNSNDPIGVYSQSAGAVDGYGIGVEGRGGWYGIRGVQTGGIAGWAQYGVYSTGDSGASGAKTFLIDHPLDPANKALRHYSIESNEITNMYRGIIKLDATGKATVNLPNYFNAANTNPSYQLTAIGTPEQPYVLREVNNNQFAIAGKPNTKVSWTIYAKRNDPTIKYFDKSGKNYDQTEVEKPAKMRGKYFTPEAYGKPSSMSVHYRADMEKDYSERKLAKKEIKRVTKKEIKKSTPIKVEKLKK
jgi:hypothetical protein